MKIEITQDMVGKILTLQDPELVTPDLSGAKTLFDWEANADGIHDYNEWALELIKGSAVRPKHHPKFVLNGGQVIEVHKRAFPPLMSSEGNLHCSIMDGVPDPHCEWRLCSDELMVKTYFHLGRTYAWRIKMRLNTPSRVAMYPNTHITFLQVWGPKPGRNPCVALQTYRGKWRIQAYGERSDNSIYLKPVPDRSWHEWLLIYRPEVVDGYLGVYMDNELVHEVKGSTAYLAEDRPGWAGQNHLGCYTPPTPEMASIDFSLIQLFEMTDA